jgi:hypothetical protein
MAILDDDFQGYTIGQSMPFGSWIWNGITAPTIVAEPLGTGIPGTDRALQVGLATAETVPSYVASFSQWVAHKVSDNANPQDIFTFTNGPNLTGSSFTLLGFRIEPDSTLTATCPTSGQTLGNSGDKLTRFGTYNFFQINVTLSDVLVAGVPRVNIQCSVYVNGTPFLSFNTTTGVAVAGLTNGTAQVNRFQLIRGNYGAYTLDVLTGIPTYPHGGTPHAIAVQAVTEVDELLTSGVIDAYQAMAEVNELPDSAAINIFQCVVEVDILEASRWYIYES